MTPHEHSALDIITRVVFFCSIAHTLLPPWEAFNDFPTAQKYYRLIIYIIGYAAGNARSTVYGSLSTKDGTHPSTAVNGKGVQAPQQLPPQQP